MRRIPIILILLLAILTGSAWGATLASYVAANPNPRVLLIGDSQSAEEVHDGATATLSAGKPYIMLNGLADRTAWVGGPYTTRLARRIPSRHVATIGAGSMVIMLGTDASRAQQDSSFFGLINSANAAKFNPQIVILHMGGNNDAAEGETYATIKSRVLATAERALDTFTEADHIVWVTRRHTGISYYLGATGADGAKRLRAIERWALLDNVATYIADTLAADLLESDAYAPSRFQSFDSRPYNTATGADTTGVTKALLGCTTQAQHDSVKHLTYAPTFWYNRADDYIHLNDYGSKASADSAAMYLFGATLSEEYVKGAGSTIYVNAQSGDNWSNATRCTSSSYPLASLQAAVSHAIPGDIIHVVGTGNQEIMREAISANSYTWRPTEPGLTVELASGAYFAGGYQASPLRGYGLFDLRGCSAGGIQDTLAATIPSLANFGAANPSINLDVTISGGKFYGYYVPFRYINYTGVTLEDTEIYGGYGGYSIWLDNYGRVLQLNMTDVAVYPDSSTVDAAKYGRVYLHMTATTPTVLDTSRYDGTWRRCTFTGSARLDAQPNITGPICGMTFIDCTWSDDLAYGTRSAIYLGGSAYTFTSYPSTKFIGCRFQTYENSSTHRAITWSGALVDTVFVINCDFRMTQSSGTPTAIYYSSAPDATGVSYLAGTAFRQIDYASGRTDMTPASATSPDYKTKAFNSPLGLTGDTLIFGGVTSFAGYSLASFDIEHGSNHASIGPTQYTGDPYVWHKPMPRTESYQQINGPWKLRQLIDNGVLATSDSLDASTWYTIPTPTTTWEEWQIRTWLDAYKAWPEATRKKIRWRIGGPGSLLSYSPAGDNYVGPWGALAAVNADAGLVSDSLDTATWWRLPKPTTRAEELQLLTYLDAYEAWPLATRRKIRWRIE